MSAGMALVRYSGMKILFVTHQFFPEHRAGTEVLTLWFARELIARGHEAAVFAAKRSAPVYDIRPGEIEDYEFGGVPVRRVGRPRESLARSFRLNYDNPVMAERLGEHLRRFRPNVVHFMHLQGVSASAITVAKREFDLPAVYTATDFWSICPVVDLRRHDGVLCTGPEVGHCARCLASRQPNPRVRQLARRVPSAGVRAAVGASHTPLPGVLRPLRQLRDLEDRPGYIRERVNSLDRIIAPTGLTRDLLVRNGVTPDLVEVSHYGIDVSSVASSRSEAASRTTRFGFIGTLGPHKGCDLLIRAFKRLPSRPEATLTIHGDPGGFDSFYAELKQLAGGDPRISFRGAFPPGEIGTVLSEMDVLVVPSRWYENTPLVLYAAFAARVPVVATDLGGLSEVVRDEENGLLFGLESVDELGAQLRRLVDEPGLVGRLRAGIGSVKTVEENVDELENLYNSLMRRRGTGG